MIDILLEADDIWIENGDLVVGDSDQQDVELILDAHPGEWRQWPLLGMGISQYLNMPADLARIQRDAAAALRYDGFQKTTLRVVAGQLVVNSIRKKDI